MTATPAPTTAPTTAPTGVRLVGATELHDTVLTPAALEFLAELHRTFDVRRRELLQARDDRYAELAAGGTLDFLPETVEVRDGDWQVAAPAPGLVDRRVEITGPTDAKMTINALNSGAKVWLADFEDASSPALENVIDGQLNLRNALDRTIDFTSPEGKSHALGEELATIVVRPRGWHLPEKHILVDDEPMSGSLVDFGLYFFHCAQRQIDAGRGPYFYLPKLESHLEARLWNDVFVLSQDRLGIPCGTVRATVLVETYPAAFEMMEEILYELREHSSGLNAGRWDYIFSVTKKFRTRGSEFMLPDRVQVTAEQLLDVASTPGDVTEAGLRNNISVGIQYLAAWLRGAGAGAIFNLTEDGATAEISRSQVWQWLHSDVTLDTGDVVTRELVDRLVDEEIARLDGDPSTYDQAKATFVEVAVADDFAELLTLPAYERMP